MENIATTKERKPLLALAASLAVPGLGQIYNGEATKGLSILLLAAFIVPSCAWTAAHGPTSLISALVFIGVAVTVAVYAVAGVDAYKSARRIGDTFSPTPFNTPYCYLALMFFAYFFVFGQLADYTRENLLSAYKVPTTSMTPGILPGDRFFADKSINRPGSKQRIQHGDIVVFVNPNDRTQTFVKRVIGLPGDRIDIVGTDLSVNGRSTTVGNATDLGSDELNRLLADHIAVRERTDSREYVVLWSKNRQSDAGSFAVPNGQVFLLGDNRDNALDSRVFGCVPLSDVVGRAEQVWFSVAKTGIRWGRVGTILAGTSNESNGR